jgi:hypothetical protein
MVGVLARLELRGERRLGAGEIEEDVDPLLAVRLSEFGDDGVERGGHGVVGSVGC